MDCQLAKLLCLPDGKYISRGEASSADWSDVPSTNKTFFNFRQELCVCQSFKGVDAVYETYKDELRDGCLDTRASMLWL